MTIMDSTYLKAIGLDVMNAESSAVGACTQGCPTHAAAARGKLVKLVKQDCGSMAVAQPVQQVGKQGGKAAAGKVLDEAVVARAAAKAAKQRTKDISQTLSMLLRHRAREVGVSIDGAGWVAVEEALAWMNGFKDDDAIEGGPVTMEEVREVTAGSDKQRFELDGAEIRATQGHSMPGIELDLSPLDCGEVPLAVHGTYYAVWEEIRRTGLKRMQRNYIHMAPDLPGESGVISGMRSSCQVLIWVDTRRAQEAGITFYRSKNGVILTEGIDGVIEPQFFDRVVDRRTGGVLEAR